jgi:hypothetical protein
LQRLLCSSKQIIVWGESGGALNNFADAQVRYQQMLGSGKQRFKHGFGGNGAKQFAQFIGTPNGEHTWIASMNPELDHIRNTIKRALDALYGEPAAAHEFPRWGVKEVLAGRETAEFLRSLYPEARFLFLVRNPYHAITSIKQHRWMDLPAGEKPIPYFAALWRDLARGFRQCDFGLKIRYEDLLTNPALVRQIRDHTGIDNLSADFMRTSKADWKAASSGRLTLAEKWRLRRIAGDEIRAWNY